MCPTVLLVNDIQRCQLREDNLQEAAALEIIKAYAGMRGQDNLVEFILDTFATDDIYPVGHTYECIPCLILYLEVQLGGETYAPHHPQGVVAEGDIRFKGSGDDTVFEVSQAIEGVDEFSEAVFIQAYRHSIDGEVTTVLVVFEGTVLNDGFPGVVAVALLTRPHKLHLILHTLLTELHLGSTEILEYAEMSLTPHHTFQFLGNTDTTAHDYHVDIVGRTLKEDIPDIASHNVAF